MSEANPVTIRVLDKEYVVSCPPNQRDSLLESARILDRRMREARDAGKVLGTERMAVMAALNIVHEMLDTRSEHLSAEERLAAEVRRLSQKIERKLGRRPEDEKLD